MASAPSQDDNLHGDEPLKENFDTASEKSLELSENGDSEGEEVKADGDANETQAQGNGAGVNLDPLAPAVGQKRNRPAMNGASVVNGLNLVSGSGIGLVGFNQVNNIYFSGPPREPPAKRRRMGGQHGWHLGLLGTLTAGTSAVAAGAFLGPHVIQAITLGSIASHGSAMLTMFFLTRISDNMEEILEFLYGDGRDGRGLREKSSQ
eukprot:595889_1